MDTKRKRKKSTYYDYNLNNIYDTKGGFLVGKQDINEPLHKQAKSVHGMCLRP